MTDRDAPDDIEDLYEARGTVPRARPILQGDVFAGIEVAGYESPMSVVITQHPCSMRQGAKLRERLSVAVISGMGSLSDSAWTTGYASAMLLPGLKGDAANFGADFREAGVVAASQLVRELRIAALSNYGVHLLHQRLVYYMTRLTVDVPTLAETFDPIATETELQWEWVEAAVDADTADEPTIAGAEKEFADFLDENNRERRERLQDASHRADVRRQVRAEIRARFDSA